ncbi:hypothetical protein K8R33_03475 [archaeon]|nr:hypothetical protein [archaeon]
MEIKANAIIEIVGSPEAHVKETMEKVVTLIKEKKEYKLISVETSEPKESELPNTNKKINIYSTFSELEISFDNFEALMNFCFEFMPSSIDILEPLNLKIDSQEVNDSLNDLLARLHQQARIIMEYTALRRKIEKAAKSSNNSGDQAS